MTTNEKNIAALDRLLKRLGGLYIPAAQLLVQLFSVAAAIVGNYYVLLNVEFSPAQSRQIIILGMFLVLSSNLIVFGLMYLLSSNARERLNESSSPIHSSKPAYEQELLAWREITVYPWRQGFIVSAVSMIGVILPAALYVFLVQGANISDVIHVVIGGLLAASVLVVFATMVLEWVLTPARIALLPKAFEYQVDGLKGAKLQTRLLITITVLIMISLLSVGPRGYQEAIRAMQEAGKTSSEFVTNLQIQLGVVAVIAFVLGGAFAFGLTRMIYRPIRNLMSTMVEIQAGNIKQRAAVIGSDEMGVMTIYFNQMLDRLEDLQTNLENQVAEQTQNLLRRAAYLEAAANVAQQATGFRHLETLLTQVVNLISERFGYYHTGLFLLDERGEYSVLQAASSEGGQRMLARGHRLRVGSQGIVGSAASKRKAHITLDVSADATYFKNPDLPETRSEAAIPLFARNKLIGVLDIQSKDPQAFSREDINALQIMANQVALAIENAKLHEESQSAIQQLQAISGETISDNWRRLAERDLYLYKYTPLGVNPLASRPMNKPSSVDNGNKPASIEIPITLRGHELGKIVLNRKGKNIYWSDKEQDVAANVANQVALALENARLLEDSKRRTAHEKTINELSTSFSRSIDIDTLLQVAAKELQQLPSVSEVSVFIGQETPEE